MGISFNAASLLSGSGIDVSQIISELQAGQSGQLTAWKADQTTLQTQATTIGNINSDLANLLSASQALSDPTGALTGLTATSSESAVLTASVQAGATPASYNVVVSGLATTGTLYTAAIGSATTSILSAGQTTGDLQVQIGGTGGTLADIPITAGVNDTLTTLAQSINSLSTQNSWGITATVVTDATGSRLALYSQASGSPGALSAGANNTTTLTFEPPVGGQDSLFTINGIPYSTTSNTVTGAIPDLTLSLLAADSGLPVQVTVGPNTTGITTAVTNFVNAYNTVVSDINSQFAFNPATNSQGTLGSDNSLHILQTSLLSALTYATSDPTSVSNGLVNLAALGIDMNDDGTLTINQVGTDTHPAFADVLADDPSGVQNFFQNSSSTGFADNLTAQLTNLAEPTTGVLSEDLTANQQQQQDLTTEINNFQTQLTAQQAQLEQVFSSVNATLEQYPFTLQEVNAALGVLNSSSVTSSTGTTAPSTDTTPTAGELIGGTGS
ncbi:MAG: flagellar filament capping protein FliD [Terriglobales bacterium]